MTRRELEKEYEQLKMDFELVDLLEEVKHKQWIKKTRELEDLKTKLNAHVNTLSEIKWILGCSDLRDEDRVEDLIRLLGGVRKPSIDWENEG